MRFKKIFSLKIKQTPIKWAKCVGVLVPYFTLSGRLHIGQKIVHSLYR